MGPKGARKKITILFFFNWRERVREPVGKGTEEKGERSSRELPAKCGAQCRA